MPSIYKGCSADAGGATGSAAPAVHDGVRAPSSLDQGFDPREVAQWQPQRFEYIKKLQDATRNRGQVHLMRDLHHDRLVAVKQMPTQWACSCHKKFVEAHPTETELPWQDVGCIRFLSDVGFEYVCTLFGVFRDDEYTYVVTAFATEGDLFSWCEVGISPSRDREVLVLPLARQVMHGVQQLHDMSIVHRDLSMENILVSKSGPNFLDVRIIDFSTGSTLRQFRNSVRGKASYQAPELHSEEEYDAFLSDAFSLGVTLYAVVLKDYPWLSTRPGVCKCFEYVRKHGLRTYLGKRKVRNSSLKADEILSEPLKQLLEGLLHLDPSKRLTLGERVWAGAGRKSVWDQAWMHTGPGD